MLAGTFESQLICAETKLRRCGDGFDPVSGFATQDIVDFIVALPELGNSEQVAKSQAVLRRNGFVEVADSFAV